MLTILEFGAWLFGLCVGSFLNVVVYRLPLGLSVAKPTWSFCPHCNHRLRARDNVPLLGWLALRGRCRDCAAPISAQYPFVEALTGLVFVLVFHWLFVARAWPLVEEPAWPRDLPLAIAWFTLAGCLVACAAMDIVSYLIDTGVTLVATLVGVVALAFWRPAGDAALDISRPALAAALAAGIICLPMLAWVFLRTPALEESATALPARRDDEDGILEVTPSLPSAEHTRTSEPPIEETGRRPVPHDGGRPVSHDQEQRLEQCTEGRPDITAPRRPLHWGLVAVVIVHFVVPAFGLMVVTGYLEALGPVANANPRMPARVNSFAAVAGVCGLAAIFGLMVLSAGQPREADDQLAAEIEHEAPAARKTSLLELLWLSPIILAATAAWYAVAHSAPAAAWFDGLLAWSPFAGMRPLAGAAFAVYGAIVAALAGWAIRLVFTLVFGREAFGVGDIYILAAAGACAGWAVALLGFLLSVGVALLAWIASLTAKRSTMIAFGPPLAIGFLLALWLYRPLAGFFARIAEEYEPLWRSSPLMVIGFFVLASVFAVLASRMLRRFIEPGEDAPDDSPPGGVSI